MAYHSLVTLSNVTSVLVSPPGTHSGIDITIQNVNASGHIYIGGTGVSSSDYGYRILPNHAISVELSGKSAIHAISSEPGMKAAVLSTSLESGS